MCSMRFGALCRGIEVMVCFHDLDDEFAGSDDSGVDDFIRGRSCVGVGWLLRR